MFYDRKIRYFDYLEQGQRVKNGGYVKLEVRDGICHILLQVSGLHETIHNTYSVYIWSGEKRERLCEISLNHGSGRKELQLSSDNLCGGIAYLQLERLQMPISAVSELWCHIEKKNSFQTNYSQNETKNQKELKETNEQIEQKTQIQEEMQEEQGGQEEQGAQEEQEAQEEHETQEEQGKQKHQELTGAAKTTVPLMEDKWKQLSAIYPHISPFQDEREYLSIGPGDFVIMSQRYYKLVNNSFLLHGFYNYRHLILTRMEKRGEMCYYIGVPGNFYEREKQVALMFGFESFECREEPAGSGDFGYYMMRVEI